MATKLYVPQRRPGLVSRPRLLERLGRGRGARLTLVCAPAGFGKTTVLTEWTGELSGDEGRVAWVSLDAGDSDPASFWAYVVAALRTAQPGLGSGVLELVESSPLPTRLVLTTLVNDLAAAPGDLWLVLDDYHLVDGSGVGEGLALLLEHLPPHVHVVVSTRADPDLPLSRWRARGQLVEIRAADLRFTSDEAATYLADASGLHLTAADVTVLEERTEGWVAALQLAALSMRGRDDVSTFVARFAGDDRYIVDYLVEEVLAHQPDRVRDFLLHSAVLDRLTGPLCDAVTGLPDGSRTLTALDRANLFLVALDDQREWYRYHHLFGDVLRARLLAEQPDLVPQLHQRASRWYAAHDLLPEAVQHALAARDFDGAAYLMELAVPAIRRSRQEAVLAGWLGALPDDAVRRSPVLSFCSAAVRLAAGDLDGVEPRLADAERALAAAPDPAGPLRAETAELETLPATVAMYRASLAQARGDVEGTARHARRALDLARPGDHAARGGASGFLGLAAWAQGDIASALPTFTQAMSSLHAAGNHVDELSSTVVLADLWLAAGRPLTARRLYERALRRAEASGALVARATADLHVGLSELDYEIGDLDAASRHLEAAATLGEQAAVGESRYRWFLAAGRVAAASGDPEEAVRLLDRAQELYRPGFFPDVRPLAAVKARVHVAHGDLAEAADWARDVGVSATAEAGYLAEFEQLTVARLLLAQHRAQQDMAALERAVALLDRLLGAAGSGGRAGSRGEIRLLRALALDAQGCRRHAVEELGQALVDLPEPDGYARLLLDEGEPMLALLRDADHRGVAPAQTRRLLGLAPAAAAEGHAQQRPAVSPAETLSERELQVVRLLGGELSGPLIARELFISHNTLRTHTKHIFAKLGVTSRRAAVGRARERGLL